MANARKKKPMTAERVENALDILAGIMAKAPKGEAVLLVPIWKRLETELEALRDAEDVVSMALKRAKTAHLSP
ncbi:hypothetical protein [Pseudochrobactrum asaccharolyticum]|uniref:Uncharacterized protein n=1 Tax=Pseudochrobactrum asaccharolyticum TaxID=354351 RepID=A0A366DH57_9HYPH|nr:hypothetical protein [Pseudochrobactrum asaccharolyticum]RBO89275.1 hypothetical protein DFR47_1163 [Pseudochrobactrum asaccharolyticum]